MITKANNSRCFLFYFKTKFKVVIFYSRQLVKKSLHFFLVLFHIFIFDLTCLKTVMTSLLDDFFTFIFESLIKTTARDCEKLIPNELND